MPQAEALDAKLEELGRGLTAVLLIDVSDDEVVRRLGGRRTCAENGHVFHVEFNPPEQEGVCDLDGSELIVRDDDKPEVIRNRLEHYHEKTEPLVDYYDQRSVLRRIDGTAAPGRGRRGDPPHPGDDAAGAGRGHLAPCRGASVYRMIIRKTPEQIEKMAAAGDILVRCLKMLAVEGAGRGHHRRARRGGREVHPLPGRRRRPSRATAASRARSAPRPTRWSSTASPAPTS